MAIHSTSRTRHRVRLWHKNTQHEWIFRGSKEDAGVFEAQKKLELQARDPAAISRSVPKFSGFCVAHYRPHAELHLRKSSWYAQSFMVATLMQHFGDLKLTELRDAHVDAFIRWRRAPVGDRMITYQRHLSDGRTVEVKYTRKASAAPGNIAINNELRVLRRILSFARERKAPVADIRIHMLDEGERRPKAWSTEQLGKLFAACAEHAPEILPLVVFLANTGCRKAEALALTWENVDLDRGEIRIWPSDEWRPKNGKPREVPISDALLPWFSRDPEGKKWVFPSATGERFAFWPKLQFTRATKAAGLTGGPHRLRHSYASEFLKNQPDLGLLAMVMGHSDEAVTRLYAHMMPARLARARNAVSIAPAMGPAMVAARKAWGAANVQESDKSGAATGAETKEGVS